MKKILLLTAVLPFMLTSCFVTRYVSDEPDLQRKFIGAHVEDVTFELGDPNKVEELQSGYAYIYEREGYDWKPSKMVDQYIRISFNREDVARYIRSTTTKKTKRFSGAHTFGVPLAALGAVVLVTAAAAATSD
ncbi:MAG: hypothetical protein LBL07_03715 [Tannerella sp.]|jgi:hypothetical protein|nr:hypothetical protein [Tannerella sp.]